MIKLLRTIGAYKRLFLDGQGQLNADARIVFEDLYKTTHFFDGKAASPDELLFLEGGRRVIRHMTARTRTGESELRRHLSKGDSDE